MHTVEIRPKVIKGMKKFLEDDKKAVFDAIKSLSKNPRPPEFEYKKLDSLLHRITIDRYRVIYTIFKKELHVVALHAGLREDRTYSNRTMKKLRRLARNAQPPKGKGED